MPVPYPKINGVAYDFSSIEFVVNGVAYTGITELNYNHTLEPGILRGTRSIKLARSRGEYNAEGTFSMYIEEYQAFREALGFAYMQTQFQAVAMYSEIGSTIVTDTLMGCRITNADMSNSAGSDPLVKQVSIDIMQILEDGQSPVDDGIIPLVP